MARPEYEKVDEVAADDASDVEHGSDSEELPSDSEEVRRQEAERLLTDAEKPGALRRSEHNGKQRSRRHKSGKWRREIMYEMEEGGPRSSSAESSGHSSEVDLARLGGTQTKRKSRRGRFFRFTATHAVIIVAFLALLYGAWRVSKGSNRVQGDEVPAPLPAQSSTPSHQEDKEPVPKPTYQPKSLSNGTHTFAPTTLLISLDGFRADFLHRNLTPTLNGLIKDGVSPKYMLPSFPSLTFPNHFTLVTGLHPESHGIVGNTFWDPELQREFYYTDPARSMQPEWWTAEPIWVTAEKNGVRTGVHMWPGSEVFGGIEGVATSYVDHFNGDERLDNKVRRILGWLDLPDANTESTLDNDMVQQNLRPQLIAAYVPNVDADGHLYGPNSTYIRSTIAEVDGMLGSLLRGLDERNLTEIVNVIIVSDHGMATTSTNRLIQLEDLVDTSLVEHIDGWPLYGLRLYDTSSDNLRKLYNSLLEGSKESKYKHAFEVYLRDENMPERYHFAHNDRIAPLWIVPEAGWAVVTKDEFDVAFGVRNDETYHPRGLHGYDNLHPLMRAMFVARGPAFPHVAGSKLEPFQNTEVYNILCDSLGIEPVANNGTLRLPLKLSGLHDFDEQPEVPEDTQDDQSLALPPEVPNLAYPHTPGKPAQDNQEPQMSLPFDLPNLANRPDFVVPTGIVPPGSPTSAAADKPTTLEQVGQPSKPVQSGTVSPDDGGNEKKDQGWWGWVTRKVEVIKGWASDLFGANDKDNRKSEDDQS